MRLLVTGAAGFIGARFVESCNARGVDVVSVDRSASFRGRPEHRSVAFGELVGVERLPQWLGEFGQTITGIVHLGAISDTTETDEARLTRWNVDYSQMLWNAARDLHVPFVYASSAAVYGNGAMGFDDSDDLVARLQPLNAYGESKRRFDLWALREARQGRKSPAWAGFRFFNVFGFGERHKGPQASVVLHGYDQIKASGRMRLFRSHRTGVADGEQERDFVDVRDAIEALWFALDKPICEGIFNLGTGRARTFGDLANALFAALDVPEAIDFVDMPPALREHYQYFTEAKMARLRAEGFTAVPVELEDGVRHYVGAANWREQPVDGGGATMTPAH